MCEGLNCGWGSAAIVGLLTLVCTLALVALGVGVLGVRYALRNFSVKFTPKTPPKPRAKTKADKAVSSYFLILLVGLAIAGFVSVMYFAINVGV